MNMGRNLVFTKRSEESSKVRDAENLPYDDVVGYLVNLSPVKFSALMERVNNRRQAIKKAKAQVADDYFVITPEPDSEKLKKAEEFLKDACISYSKNDNGFLTVERYNLFGKYGKMHQMNLNEDDLLDCISDVKEDMCIFPHTELERQHHLNSIGNLFLYAKNPHIDANTIEGGVHIMYDANFSF